MGLYPQWTIWEGARPGWRVRVCLAATRATSNRQGCPCRSGTPPSSRYSSGPIDPRSSFPLLLPHRVYHTPVPAPVPCGAYFNNSRESHIQDKTLSLSLYKQFTHSKQGDACYCTISLQCQLIGGWRFAPVTTTNGLCSELCYSCSHPSVFECSASAVSHITHR